MVGISAILVALYIGCAVIGGIYCLFNGGLLAAVMVFCSCMTTAALLMNSLTIISKIDELKSYINRNVPMSAPPTGVYSNQGKSSLDSLKEDDGIQKHWICESCGEENSLNSRYCSKCGKDKE